MMLVSERQFADILDRTPADIRKAVADGRLPTPCRELEWSDFWHVDTVQRIRREMTAGTLVV